MNTFSNLFLPHNTHRGYTTCLSAGRPFSMEAPTKPPLSLAPGWHKGPRSGVTWKAGAPNTLFSCFFFHSLSLSPSYWNLLLSNLPLPCPPPPIHPFPPSLFPLFCRSSGPIVWTASSTPSSSSGSPLKPSSMVSSSQRLLHGSRWTWRINKEDSQRHVFCLN